MIRAALHLIMPLIMACVEVQYVRYLIQALIRVITWVPGYTYVKGKN